MQSRLVLLENTVHLKDSQLLLEIVKLATTAQVGLLQALHQAVEATFAVWGITVQQAAQQNNNVLNILTLTTQVLMTQETVLLVQLVLPVQAD